MKKLIAKYIVLVCAFALVFAGAAYYVHIKNSPKVEASSLMERIEQSSELTTSKLYYNGVVEFAEGSIPFIDKNGFLMKYEAVIRAGFNLEEVDIDVTDDAVTVTVPKAEILDISIDPESLEFYDNAFSIFKSDRKEATKEAEIEAKKDAEEHATKKGLLEEADSHADVVFKGILSEGIGTREVIVKHK